MGNRSQVFDKTSKPAIASRTILFNGIGAVLTTIGAITGRALDVPAETITSIVELVLLVAFVVNLFLRKVTTKSIKGILPGLILIPALFLMGCNATGSFVSATGLYVEAGGIRIIVGTVDASNSTGTFANEIVAVKHTTYFEASINAGASTDEAGVTAKKKSEYTFTVTPVDEVDTPTKEGLIGPLSDDEKEIR